MQNIVSRCSSSLTFVHNGEANVLLPLVNVDVEVVAQPSGERDILSFTATPNGIKSVIDALVNSLQKYDAAMTNQPTLITEEQWFESQKPLEVEPETPAETPAENVSPLTPQQ